MESGGGSGNGGKHDPCGENRRETGRGYRQVKTGGTTEISAFSPDFPLPQSPASILDSRFRGNDLYEGLRGDLHGDLPEDLHLTLPEDLHLALPKDLRGALPASSIVNYPLAIANSTSTFSPTLPSA